MESSGTTSREVTTKESFCRSCATAGPERSSRSPRAQVSLTVTTAAVRRCGSVIIDLNITTVIVTQPSSLKLVTQPASLNHRGGRLPLLPFVLPRRCRKPQSAHSPGCSKKEEAQL